MTYSRQLCKWSCDFIVEQTCNELFSELLFLFTPRCLACFCCQQAIYSGRRCSRSLFFESSPTFVSSYLELSNIVLLITEHMTSDVSYTLLLVYLRSVYRKLRLYCCFQNKVVTRRTLLTGRAVDVGQTWPSLHIDSF